MKYPEAIQKIIDRLSELPTVGPKTAERYALFLLRQPNQWLNELAQDLSRLKNDVKRCSVCHNLSASDPCLICQDNRRDRGLLCVVSETKDLLAIENSKSYNGLYHILGGTINAVNNLGPENLSIKTLLDKLKTNTDIKEVILALNPDFEGEATCLYLLKTFKQHTLNQKISRLAKGLPTGASVEYADQSTLGNALKYRNKIT